MCGTGFSFSRELVGDHTTRVAYVPDFMTESTSCGEEIETSADYNDAVKNLVVGETYQYCVASVGNDYMVDINEDNGRLVRRSDPPTCLEHVVAWVGASSLVMFFFIGIQLPTSMPQRKHP